MPPIPVTLLTGFLGSGKTTLLNRILRHPGFGDAAVVVNEFGEVGIDHHLIAAGSEQVVRMSTGCLCCTVRSDIRDTLLDLWRQMATGQVPPFTRVIVETTGLADPAPVIHTLMTEPSFSGRYMLGGIVATLDAVNGEGSLDTHPECLKQAAVADRIVLTKRDLAPDDRAVRARIKALNPNAAIIDADAPGFNPARLFDTTLYDPATKTFDVRRWLGEAAGSGHHDDHHHDPNRHGADIRAVSLVIERPISTLALTTALKLLIANRGARLLRVKGIINLAEEPENPVVIHGVQHVFHDPIRLDAWPDEDRRTRLVFITNGIEPGLIETFFAAWGTLGDATAQAALGGAA